MVVLAKGACQVFLNSMHTFYTTLTLQNVSLVNTVLATIVADTFREFSDAIEMGQMPKTVAQKALKESWKVMVLCLLWMVFFGGRKSLL